MKNPEEIRNRLLSIPVIGKIIYLILFFLSKLYLLGLIIHKTLSTSKEIKGIKKIAIGNITVGGSGKTSFSESLSKLIKRELKTKICIISHGYKSKAKTPVIITQNTPLKICGDEAKLLYENLKDEKIDIIVSKSKIEALRFAQRKGYQIAIIDDALQSHYLKKDLEILLINSIKYICEDKLLPLGNLREPLGSLKRFEIAVLTYTNLKNSTKKLLNCIKKMNPNLNIITSQAILKGIYNYKGKEVPKEELSKKDNIWGICAIGNPEGFKLLLQKEEIPIKGFISLIDHFSYKDFNFHKDRLYITTQKDFVKIKEFQKDIDNIFYTKIEFIINDPKLLLNKIKNI